jgi:hypothetical protein
MDAFSGGTYVTGTFSTSSAYTVALAPNNSDGKPVVVRSGQRLLLECLCLEVDQNQPAGQLVLVSRSDGAVPDFSSLPLFTWNTPLNAASSVVYPSGGTVVALPRTSAANVAHSYSGVWILNSFSIAFQGSFIGRIIGG